MCGCWVRKLAFESVLNFSAEDFRKAKRTENKFCC